MKSAVINTLHNAKQKGETLPPADVAASFQASVVDVLVGKTIRAAEEFGAKQIIVAGGVAANKGLRASLEEAFADKQAELLIPPLALCTDNAAMIGAAASILYHRGKFVDMSMNARASMPL